MEKIAVVTTLCVVENMRKEYQVINEELRFQETYNDNKLDNIKFMIKSHEHFDPGMDYDLILIDNSTTNKEALEYYDTLKYPRYVRENNGFSFGGYKYAWEKFMDKYDYYLFHEQDCCPAKHGWLKEIYNKYNSDDGYGAIGNVVEYRHIDDGKKNGEVIKQFNELKPRKDYIENLDGTFTFTSLDVLKCLESKGGIKIIDGKIETSTLNELLFTMQIEEIGYKLGSFGNRDFTKTDTIHWYGIRKGNLTRPFDKNKLAPIVEGTVRHTCKQMKQYYNEEGI